MFRKHTPSTIATNAIPLVLILLAAFTGYTGKSAYKNWNTAPALGDTFILNGNDGFSMRSNGVFCSPQIGGTLEVTSKVFSWHPHQLFKQRELTYTAPPANTAQTGFFEPCSNGLRITMLPVSIDGEVEMKTFIPTK